MMKANSKPSRLSFRESPPKSYTLGFVDAILHLVAAFFMLRGMDGRVIVDPAKLYLIFLVINLLVITYSLFSRKFQHKDDRFRMVTALVMLVRLILKYSV